MESIKKFSLIIILTIIFDLLVNIFLPNRYYMNNYGTDENIIINGLLTIGDEENIVVRGIYKDRDENVLPNAKNMMAQISRIAAHRNVISETIIRQIADKLMYVDVDLATKCIDRFIDEDYRYYVYLYENHIDKKTLEKTTKEVSKISDRNLFNIAKKLLLHKYTVYFVDKKKGNYMLDSLGDTVITCKSSAYIYDRLIRKGSNFNVTNINKLLHQRGDISVITAKIKQKYYENSEDMPNVHIALKQLYVDLEAQSTFIITKDGLRFLSFMDPDRCKMYQISTNPSAIRATSLCCYIFTEEINKHYHNIKQEDLLYIGDIYYAGNMRAYSPRAGIVRHNLEQEKLEYIVDLVNPEIWNNNTNIIVITPVGMYYICKTPCEDTEIIQQAYAIYTAAHMKTEANTRQISLLVPSNYITEFKSFYQKMFGYTFNTMIAHRDYIDYNRRVVINLENVKGYQKYHVNYPNYDLVKLIYDGYIFKA